MCAKLAVLERIEATSLVLYNEGDKNWTAKILWKFPHPVALTDWGLRNWRVQHRQDTGGKFNIFGKTNVMFGALSTLFDAKNQEIENLEYFLLKLCEAAGRKFEADGRMLTGAGTDEPDKVGVGAKEWF